MSNGYPPVSVAEIGDTARWSPATNTNTEPGFANTYGPGSDNPGGMLAAAVPAVGVGALSLYLLYQRHLQDKARADALKAEKQADLQDQLPGFHAKDVLLGSALGGGAGLIYDLAAKHDEKEKRLPKALKRILGGAAIGGVGANLLGDRLRRYISNTLIPGDYGVSNKARQLLPTSFKKFVDAAVLDKPSFDEKDLADVQNVFHGNKQLADDALNARRELIRIGFGVHSNKPNSDYWQKNKAVGTPDYYSLNEQNPAYRRIRDNLFGPDPDPDGAARANLKEMLKDPTTIINNENAYGQWWGSGLFGAGTLLGGQQIVVPPAGSRKPYIGRVLDRFDVTPEKAHTDYVGNAFRSGKALKPSWWSAIAAPQDSTAYTRGQEPQTNAQLVGGLIPRVIWDKLLTKRHPWVSQQFAISPDRRTSILPFVPGEPGSLELLRESGQK